MNPEGAWIPTGELAQGPAEEREARMSEPLEVPRANRKRRSHAAVSYTHLTLPTNREV